MTPTLANLSTVTIIMSIPTMLSALFFFAVAIAGFAGVYFALSTRADAFDAADRQNKNTWALILGGSALVACSPAVHHVVRRGGDRRVLAGREAPAG